MKIIHAEWFTGMQVIGIVVGEDEHTKEKKAYIGVVAGTNEEADANFIARNGSPVMKESLEAIIKKMGG